MTDTFLTETLVQGRQKLKQVPSKSPSPSPDKVEFKGESEADRLERQWR